MSSMSSSRLFRALDEAHKLAERIAQRDPANEPVAKALAGLRLYVELPRSATRERCQAARAAHDAVGLLLLGEPMPRPGSAAREP